MPRLIDAGAMRERNGDGWVETVLAEAATIGAPAMVARRLRLAPGAAGPDETHGDENAEAFVFIVEGTGMAEVGIERMALAPETMVWLEPGDRYRLVAGPEGLEALLACAPGRPKGRDGAGRPE